MATDPEPDRLPDRYRGKWLIDVSIALCGAMLVAMVLLVASDVICRSVFGFDLEVTEELAGYMLVAFSFLSLAGCAAHGAYHRVEMLTGRLSQPMRHRLNIVFMITSLGLALVLDYELTELVLSSYTDDVVAPTLLATPLWIPQLSLPIGTSLLCVALAIMLVRMLVAGRARPQGTVR
jgi:TRAP-type C4-dicarboxylate transport system permease small subunit